ncbi:prealbumin-like fold domain-containing protein [Microbacterium thalli]|uniref:LPXTG cell wall anchor domain-containing protein n=1 Tax=Microbacterium thalli TaxID=3027921 RepID=A0ABT5SK29_9MICO|nr:LPXTG cell wall anchor domain-containing protein [Microbacterium thalli]MDD7963147.1 LPXTG cell wall anchor domain-containing protein [Microbacterium thalli]
MASIRRARAQRGARAHRIRGAAAYAAVAALTLGLLSTPVGAAAVPSAAAGSVDESVLPPASADAPAADATDAPPPPTPEPAPAATAAPDTGVADAPSPTPPDPADDTTPAPSPSPAPEGITPTPEPDPTVAPSTRATRAARAPPGEARIGILAAGVPEGPRPVWQESFEQGLTTTTPSGVTTYAANRFAASSGWAIGTNCTGVLVNFTATYPNASFCPTQTVLGVGQSSLAARETRRLADALGQLAAGVVGGTAANAPVNGSTSGTTGTQSNHALVALPYATVAGGTTVAQTNAAIGVTAAGSRYYTLRFDAAGAQCGTNNASLSLSLFTGTTTLLNAFPTPVVPCAATGSVFYSSPAQPTLGALGGVVDPAISPSARAATYTGTAASLLTPAQISAAQVRLTNTVTGTGSAFGIDNLRVLDVSPALDAAFSPSPAVATTPTTLTYTVTNTADLLAKTDWNFAATLPSGLVVAPAPGVGGTCTNVTGTAYSVTAAAGAGTITVAGGDLAAGQTTCTVTVTVVAAAAGTYSSGTVTAGGLIVSPAAPLTVQPATTVTVRKIITARTSPTDQFTLSVRSGTTVLGSATTSGTAADVQAAQVGPIAVPAGSTVTIHETASAGAGLGYGATYECVRSGTVIAAGTSPSGSLTMPAEQGAQVVCTFTNAPQQPRLQCDTNHYYAVTADGTLVQGDIVSGGVANVGTWNVGTNANALGISPGGETAYALQRSTDATDVAAILKWTPSGGFQTLAGTAYTTVGGGAEVPGSLVAGAVDPRTGRYVFGKYNGSAFHLWSFTESAPAASRYSYIGSFATTGSPDGNGDLAFDAAGNLYVLGASVDANGQSSAVIFTITAESLATASGGSLPVGATTSRTLTGLDATPAFGAANGIAFSPRGTAYVSSGTAAYEFDATTWARIPGSSRTTVAHTDLASCTSPSSITVLKNVVGRAAASDQFTLTLTNGATTVATTTTTGSATGRQTRQIGPVPAPVGATFSFSETMAAGSASAIGVYTVVNECWADGVRLSNAAATSGSVTIPNRQSVNVVCTLFNSPRPAASVTLTKQVLDPVTGTAAPAAGWTLGTTAVATTGTATVLPSEAPRQQTDAAGRAVWSVLFGSAASRATLTISEEQRTGFVFDRGSCTVNGAATPVTFTTSGSIVSASIPGVASSAVVACTIVNRPAANLSLTKVVSFGSAVPSDWVLSAAAPAGSTALAGPRGRSGTGAVSAVPVTPGIPYRLSESGPLTTYVQVGDWRCVDANGATVPVSAAGDVTLAAGADVTCSVTNATATLTVVKEVVGAQDGFRPADWTITATPDVFAGGTVPTQSRPGAAYAPGGNASSTFEVRPGHGYTLSEEPTRSGSRLAYQTLRLERLVGSTWTAVPSAAIVAPAPGENAVYRFVNAPVQPTTLPLTGGTGADAFFIAGAALLGLVAIAIFLRTMRRRRLM